MSRTPLLRSADEVRDAVTADSRLSAWAVLDARDEHLELSCPAGAVVLAWPGAWRDPERWADLRGKAAGDAVVVLIAGREEDLDGDVGEAGVVAAQVVVLPITVARLALTLRAAEEALRTREAGTETRAALARSRYENDLLISVGRMLSKQRDIASLLNTILARAREVTGADAGSVYIVDGQDEDVRDRRIRFMCSQNDTVRVESDGFTMPVSARSIVGTCVISREALNIKDLRELDAPGGGNNPWGFVHDRSWDEKNAYQTRSMLTVPMISAREDVIGVIQLINKVDPLVHGLNGPEDFETAILPFDDTSTNFAMALASQAGIALETALLYDEVQKAFEGFVRASVTAIESRDPTTSGHSERVARLTLGLADAVSRSDDPEFRSIRFSPDEFKEIEYAALLHDFGKVGVREHVLVKAKKLHPHELDAVVARFDFVRKAIEAEGYERRLRLFRELGPEEAVARLRRADNDYSARLEQLDEYLETILKANEPTVLAQDGFERLADIGGKTYLDPRGVVRPYLTDREVAALQVPRGSLTSEERAEIEQHVVHTYNFLKRIPWSRNLKAIPEIAVSHHEKLDGSGYPFSLSADSIAAPTRMMTISDIYDALTASDRPYKRALPRDRALDILAAEVTSGHLDAALFKVFVEARIYALVSPDD